MEKVIKAIDDSDWGIRTKKSRINFILNLKNELSPDTNSFKFLDNYELVSNYILDKYDNTATRKNQIIAIKSILSLLGDKRSYDKYDILSKQLIDDNDEARGNNVVSDKDKEKYDYSYEELKRVPDKIKDNIIHLFNKLYLNNDEIKNLNTIECKHKYYRLLTDYIISLLYLNMAPVRSDWGTVHLDKDNNKDNYYDYKTGLIYWNDFKNIKSMGPQVFKLNTYIKDNIKSYVKVLNYIIKDPIYLLYTFSSKEIIPFTREKFSGYFIRMMKTYTGIPFNINSIRHIYETTIINSQGYNNLTINQKKEIHNQLLHNYKTAQEYIKINQ